MQGHHEFARGAVLPSWWANAIGRATSVGADGLRLEATTDGTGLRVQASSAAGRGVVVKIAGRWRWNEATTTRQHPGGAAATFDVFATARANDIRSVPQPGTDATDYSFALAIVATGQTPTLGSGVEIVQLVGRGVWDGSRIVRVAQTVGGSAVDDLLQRTPQGTILGPGIQPIGSTAGWASADQPVDTTWRILNGDALGTIADFPDLAIACPQMVAAGAITLPDYRERMSIGPGTVDGTARTVGQKFGADRVTLTKEQLPAHGVNHGLRGYDARFGMPGGGGTVPVQPTGGSNWNLPWGGDPDYRPVTDIGTVGESHSNVPRAIVENRIIRVR